MTYNRPDLTWEEHREAVAALVEEYRAAIIGPITFGGRLASLGFSTLELRAETELHRADHEKARAELERLRQLTIQGRI